MKTINAKLGSMRKVANWVVYPNQFSNNDIFIQCDKRCASIDPVTGKGKLSKAMNYPGFHALVFNSEPIQVSPELLAEIIGATPKSGEAIGGGVYIA